ncbi:TPA: hypothetical protein JX704_002941 [Escherichia coli]|nr:hypothetical protein [Escherichia coli]HAX0449566.1 hypothetical protein [Escherichia coli]HAX0454014.1 hypothetical protein [Escherichia coli]HAX0458435.1 hypothetical protein [Escherichia coli]HAX0467986.1 hypothetical protein [Escherichia coli]
METYNSRQRGNIIDFFVTPEPPRKARKNSEHIEKTGSKPPAKSKSEALFTLAKLRSCKRSLYGADLKNTAGKTHLITLKPHRDTTPEDFAHQMSNFKRAMTRQKIPYFYVVEWAKFENVPHVHVLANVEDRQQAEKLVGDWLKRARWEHRTELKERHKQAGVVVEANTEEVKTYLLKQMHDIKGANRMANCSPHNWSAVNVWGSSRNWKRHHQKSECVTFCAYSQMRRTALKLQASNSKTAQNRRAIESTLKRANNRSVIIPIEIIARDRKTFRSLIQCGTDKQKQRERLEALAGRVPVPKPITDLPPIVRLLRRTRVEIAKKQRLLVVT